MNAPTIEAAVEKVATTGVALFGEIAKMYEESYLGRTNQIAKPTHVKDVLPGHVQGQAAPQPDPAQGGRGLAA
jgi:hypothetical protein